MLTHLPAQTWRARQEALFVSVVGADAAELRVSADHFVDTLLFGLGKEC